MKPCWNLTFSSSLTICVLWSWLTYLPNLTHNVLYVALHLYGCWQRLSGYFHCFQLFVVMSLEPYLNGVTVRLLVLLPRVSITTSEWSWKPFSGCLAASASKREVLLINYRPSTVLILSFLCLSLFFPPFVCCPAATSLDELFGFITFHIHY